MTAIRIAVFVAGLLVVLAVVGSAVRTVVIPRAIPARLTRYVFMLMRTMFRVVARPKRPYGARDRIMARYAPVSLLVLLLVWVVMIVLGYTAMFWGLGESVGSAFAISGSAVLTLGFAAPDGVAQTGLVLTAAAFGLTMLALLITYLPSIYAIFSRRENLVAGMEVRAGSPPSAVEILNRAWRVDGLTKINVLWRRGEQWFLELQETHTSFPSLVFFRSPEPDHSWITAAGAILDAASLMLSTIDRPFDSDAAYCVRAGYLSLRRIAAFFRIPFDPDPSPTDAISIEREEFDDAVDSLRAQGLPVVADLDEAWRAFAGWRVNYDRVLVALAGLTMAPYAPWSSDRSIRDWRPRASLRALRRS